MGYLDLSRIKSVIFDFDGLLVNSEDVIGACWVKTCEHFNITYPKGFFDNIVGVSKDVTYRELLDYMDDVVDEETFFNQRAAFIAEEVELGNVKLMPGVKVFLDKLRLANIPMFIATSSSNTWPENITTRLNIRHFFSKIYGYEDVTAVKPNPELYLKVIEENKLDKLSTVIFEDSLSGITAATSAQVDTIVVNPIKYNFTEKAKRKILFQINSFNELETDRV